MKKDFMAMMTYQLPMSIARLMMLACALCISISSMAQQKNAKVGEALVVTGVYDSFTNMGLRAFVTLLRDDSTVIDTATCKVYSGNSYVEFYIPKISGEYMLRAEHPGYRKAVQKQRFDFSQSRRGWGFDDIKLKRLPTAEDSIRSIDLDEVVVKGTRLQVAYRGDTLVYDAQAFNIPEGAMIDALVRQLPGAEMKANGDVYINGKRLDYITLNGNDFFKGNNKVILENLPYFVVKELKVYYKDPPFALVKPTDDSGKDYVLDVSMKREYAVGSIVNAEAGMGTDDRWKAKLFGLRYNEYTRLAVFGNVNNVNEDRTPSTDGDWSPRKQQRGLLTTRQAGLDLNANNAKKTFSLNHSLLAEWSDQNTTLQQRSETFSPSGNIFGGTLSASRNKNFRLTNKTQFDARIGKTILNVSHTANYNNGDGTVVSADSTYREVLINTDRSTSSSNIRNFNGYGNAAWHAMIGPHNLGVNINYSYGRQSRGRNHLLRDIRYLNTGMTDGRNDYRDNTSRNYNYTVAFSQSYRLSSRIRLHNEISYRQRGDGRDNGYYRFYPYGGLYESHMLLPSTTDSLQAAMDRSNSYDYFTLGRSVGSHLSVSYNWKNTSASISARYYYTHDRISYHNAGLDTVARRNYGSWNPNFSLEHRWKKNKLNVRYYAVSSRPDFSRLMPLNDNSNVLYVRLHNPDLQSEIRNTVNVKLDMKPGGIKPKWWMEYEFVTLSHAWGSRVNYNTTTGGYTSMADNVNGNWNTNLAAGMNGYIGRQRRWSYDLNVRLRYVHSVDFNIAYNDADNALSRVNTFRPETSWKLNYRLGNFSIGTVARFSGNMSHEEEYGQRDMNVYDWQLGFNSQYTIPVVKLTVGTDLNLFSRNGYENATMNTDDWVWNAVISRSLLKGRMVAKIEMYDILHQLSARSYSVNAQSRVETYYNSIPHYVMFSLAYRFTKNPK